jgi:hypothetical protein
MGAQFLLYTPEQPNTAQPINFLNANASILALTADFTKGLTMIVHGYTPQLPDNKTWLGQRVCST